MKNPLQKVSSSFSLTHIKILQILNLPLRSVITLTFFIILTLSRGYAQLNGNYTIGPSGNYTTFTAAVAAINASGVNGPVVFDVVPGIYTGSISINQIVGATSINTITFRSQNGDSTSVVLNGTTTTPIVTFNGADYIHFRGITMNLNGISNYCMNFANSAQFNVIENCRLLGSANTGTSTATTYAIVQSTSSTLNDQGNTIRNNVINGGSYGIYWNGWTTSPYESGLVIEGNEVLNAYNTGIFAQYLNAPIIRNNYVNNLSSANVSAMGMYANYCINNLVLTNNNIISRYMGLRVGYSTGTTLIRPLVANNFVSIYHSTGTTIYSVYTNNNNYLDFYHNSVNSFNNNPASASYTWYETSSTNSNFQNNIFSNEGQAGTNNYAAYIATNVTTRVVDYNDYWFPSGATNIAYHPNLGQVTPANFPAFQNALYGGVNSISINPQFISFHDLHHFNNQLNTGLNLISVVGQDIDGQTRAVPITIGADQFSPVPDDAGVLSMENIPMCPGVQPVMIKIRNYGTQALTSATINWSVNNVPQTLFSWTGNIAPLDSSLAFSIGNFNFAPGNSFIVVISTANPNGNTDVNTHNDAIVRNATPALSGNYTIGPAGNYLNFTSAVHDLIARGICSAVTFQVANGTYSENISIPQIVGSSPVNTITFESQNNDSTLVILQGTGSFPTVIFNGADYVRFRKMSIYTTTFRAMDFLNTAVGNVIENCYIQGYNINSTLINYCVIYSAATATVDSLNTFRNNRIRYGSYGIYWNGLTTGTYEPGMTIEGNTILDNYVYGIYLTYTNGAVIRYNEIDQLSVNYASARGIYLNYAANSPLITHNQVRSRQYGIHIQNSLSTSLNRGLVANNFITLQAYTATTLYGLFDQSSQFIDYFHNSVNTTNINATNAHYSFYSTGSQYNYFRNNIFNNNGPAGTVNYAAYVSAGNGTTLDYNDYWVINGSSYIGYHNISGSVTPVNFNTNYRTVAAGGINSRSVNPQFISNTNLRHTVNNLNFGDDLISRVGDDIDYQNRTNFVTVGAYEYEPGPNDAGISSILTSPPCQGVSGFHVVLTNYGSAPLTSVTINWTINSITQPTFNWTGNLAPGASISPVTVGSYNFIAGFYTYQAFTSNPNGQTDFDPVNDLSSGSGNPAMGGTYTIGPSGNFPSFTTAVSSMQSAGLCSPIIFLVQDGTYNENVIINQITGSSAINTITFQGLNNDSSLVLLNGSGTTPTINLNGADYVTFRSLTIQALTYRCVDMGNTAISNTIERCRLIGYPAASTATTYSAIYSAATGTFDDNNQILNNRIENGSYGIYWNGRTAVPYEAGMRIENNLILDSYSYGVFLGYMNSPVVRNNIINNENVANASAYGIYLNYCYDSMRITGNHITSKLYGFYHNYCQGNQGMRGLIANNFIYTKPTAANTIFGMRGNYSQYLDVFHNSIFTQNAGLAASYTLYEGYSSNITYQNNIFHNNGPATTNNYSVYILNGANKTFNYNNYFVPSGSTNLAYHDGLGAFPVGNWTNFNTLTYGGINSVFLNSGFVSNSNLRHFNTQLNVGNNHTSIVGNDIDRQIRTVPVSIGAFEFDQIQVDAGVASLLNNPPCIGNSPVTVFIRNYGLNTLSSVDIHWSVNNIPQTPFSWSGSLPSNTMSLPINLGTFNFITGNNYNLNIYTNNPNGQQDLQNFNDTLTVSSLPALGGTFTIGGGGDYPNFTLAVNDMILRGLCGPVVFRVLNGTYTETVTIPQISGSSAQNTITFESFNNDSTLVVLQSNTTNVVFMNGADFVRFRRLTIQNTGLTGRVFEFSNATNYNRIENCILNGSVTNTNTTAYAVIYSNATGTFDDFNEIRNNVINQGSYGIYWYGRNAVPYETGLIIENNRFNGNSIRGIDLQYMNSPIVRNNVIRCTTGTYATSYGIYLSYCYNTTQVTRNDIHSKGFGLYTNYLTGTATNRALIANNFITTTPVTGQAAAAYGVYINFGSYTDFYHNSVNVENMHLPGSYATYAYYDNAPTYMNNRNNSFRQFSASSTATNVMCAYLRGSTGTTYDYNNYYINPANTYIANHINFGNMTNTQWSTLLTANYGGLNSINVNPGYVTQSNLHLYNQAMNVGLDLTSVVSQDIDGQVRTVPVTIGADEYDPTPDDAGVNTIVSFLPACQGNSNVILNIRNFGTSTLTSATINWSVNNVIQTPFNWTGSLANLAVSANLTVGNYNFLPGIQYTINAWTTSPNGNLDGDPVNDLASSTSAGPLAGLYNVGPNGHFMTFTSAVNALVAQGVCGPVVFAVENGLYSENLIIPQITGASTVNTITFESQSGDSTQVILSGTGTTNTVFMNGADYFIWKQLTIQTQAYRCFEFSNTAVNNTIMNCLLLGWNSAQTATTYAVIYSAATGTNDANTTITNNVIRYGSHGVYWNGWTTVPYETGFVFTGNYVYDQYFRGVHIQYLNAPIISNNIINVQNTPNAAAIGLYMYFCSNGARLTHNDIRGRNIGLQYGSNVATTGNRGLVANNFISAYHSTGTTIYAMYTLSNQYQDYFHNSVNSLNGSTTTHRTLFCSSDAYSSYRNNIFCNQGPNGTTSYAAYITAGTGTTFDFNDYFVQPGNTYLAYHNSYGSFTPGLWTTFRQTAYGGPNSININPQFFTLSDLHHVNINLNAGDNLTTLVPDDIDGQTRTVPITIGATEYNPSPDDAGAVSILPLPPCPGNTPVQATIRNWGTANLTSAIVNWSVNNVAQTPFNWTGNLTSGAVSTAFTLGSFNFVAGSTYNITVSTQSPNGQVDGNPLNDSYSYIGGTALSGTYVLGNTGNYPSFGASLSAMINNGICGPVVFRVQNGFYPENLIFPPIPGASSVNTIRYESFNNDSTLVTLSGSGTTATIFMNGADYITFRRITIHTQGYRCFDFGNTATDNTIENCILNGFSASSTSNVYSTIYSVATTLSDANTTIRNNVINSGNYGIYWNGFTTLPYEPGFVLENNLITGAYYMGVYLSYMDAPVIRGNIIDVSQSAYASTNGLNLIYTRNATIVSYNDIRSRYSGTVLQNNIASAGQRGLFMNNFISSIRPNAGVCYGLQHSSNQYWDYFHNSVNTFSNNAGSTHRTMVSTSETFANYLNNIFNNLGPVSSTVAYSAYVTPGTGFSMDNNCYNVAAGSTYLAYYSVNYTPAQWLNFRQTNIGGINSININPQFVSNVNLHHSTSGLNAGADLRSIVPDDIDGIVRTIPVTIGAVEFKPGPPDPASITAGTNPLCIGNGTQLTAVGAVGTVYWYTASCGGTLVGTGNPISVTPSVTTTYYARNFDGSIYSNGCASITINVDAPITANTIGNDQTICATTTTAGLTGTNPSGGNGTFTYTWEESTDQSNWSLISGATNSFFVSGGLSTNMYYRRIVTSGGCAPSTSAFATVTVLPNITPSVSISVPSTTVCQNHPVTFTAAPVNEGNNPVYQWEVNGNPVGPNASTFTTSSLNNNEVVSLMMTSNAFCASPLNVISNSLTITVNPGPSTPVPVNNGPLCSGGSLNLSVSPISFASYSWQGPNGFTSSNVIINIPSATSNLSGVYTITVTVLGCTSLPATTTVSVQDPLGPQTLTSAQTICAGTSAALLSGANPSGGSGVYDYQWESGTDNVNWTSISGATQIDLAPGVLNASVYYRRIVQAGVCAPSTSPGLGIEVNPVISNNIISGNQSVCQNILPALITGTVPTGGNGIYTYSWESSPDGNNWSILSASGIDYQPVLASVSTYFRRMVNAGVCTPSSSAAVVLTVDPLITNNQITASQTLCAGNVPQAFIVSAPGGGTGQFQYQWEESTDNINWLAISGETSLNYSAPVINQTRYFRRTVSSGACTDSQASLVIVAEPGITNNVISQDQTLCAGATAAQLNGTQPTGGTGSYQYQWVSSSDQLTWNIVTGANGMNYTPGTVFNTMHLRRTIQSGVCPVDSSLVLTLTVDQPVVGNILSGNQTICALQTPPNITGQTPSGGNGVFAYQWQTSADGSNWTIVTGETAGNMIPTGLTSNTYFRRIVQSGICGASTSIGIHVAVLPALTGNSIGNAQTICIGSFYSGLTGQTPSGGTGSYSYQWESGTNNLNFSNIAGANAIGLNPGSLLASTYFRRMLISGSCTLPSASVLIQVDSLIGNNSIGNAQSICSGFAPALLTGSVPTGGSGNYTYTWESSSDLSAWAGLPGGNTQNYQDGILNTSRYYRRTVGGSVCSQQTSVVVPVSVTAYPSASLGGTHTICTGSSAQLQVNFGGGGPWDLTWTDGINPVTTSSITHTPHFITVNPVSNTTYSLSSVFSACTGTVSGSATVEVRPVPSATLSGSNTLCVGSNTNLSFNLSGVGPWDVTYSANSIPQTLNGITQSPYVINVTPASTHTYAITGIFATCPGLVSGTPVVVVNPIPSASLSGTQTICTGSTANLTINLGGAAPWDITLHDGTSAIPVNGILNTPYVLSLNPTVNTLYQLQDVWSTCMGNVNGSANVTVNPVPDAVISGSQTVCSGYPAQVSIQLSGVGPWDFTYSDGITPTAVNNILQSPYVITITPTAARTYTMNQVFATCTGTVSGSVALGISNPPAAFIAGNNNICQGESSVISIGLSGFAPWSLTYTDGLTPVSVTGINTSPYTFTVTPGQTTLYTLQSLTANCAGTVNGQANVLVKPVPTASFASNIIPVCTGNQANVDIHFTGVQPWDVTYTDGVTPVVVNGITSSPYTFTLTPIVNENFTITDVFATCPGSIGIASVVVQPEVAPTATLSGDHTVCITQQAPLNVTFTGTGPWNLGYTNGLTNYTVNGITSNPAIVNVSPGSTQQTYFLNSVTGACAGTVSGTSVVDIVSKPVANLSAPAGICMGLGGQLSVQLSGTGPWDVSYTDGTNIFTESNILSSPHAWVVIPMSDISYQLTGVSDIYCSGNVLSTPIFVPVSIQPQATLSSTQTICNGTSALLSLSVSGQAPWDIVYDDGLNTHVLGNLSGDTLISVSPNMDMTYTLNTVSTRGCIGISNGSEVVSVVPAASVADAGLDQNICSNVHVLNANLPSAGNGYWHVLQGSGVVSIPDTNSTSVNNLSVGVNQLEWVITNGQCESRDTLNLQVSIPPSTADAGPDLYICGTAVVLNANTPVNGIGTWTVISGMGMLANPNDPNSAISNLSLGQTVLEWTVVSGGCISTSTVTLNAALNAPVSSAGSDQLVCDVFTQMNASIPLTGIGYWQVIGGTGIITDTLNPQAIMSNLSNGISSAVWVTKNGGCMAQDTVHIQVVDPPIANFTYIQFGFDVDFENLSQGGQAAYEWTFGDGSISNAVHPHHTFMQAGEYPIRLIITNICKSDTMYDTVRIGGVSADNLSSTGASLTLYPNPADAGFVELRAHNITGESIRIRMYNILGAEVMIKEIFTEGRTQFQDRIELGAWLSRGTYTVVMETDSGVVVEKLIIR